MFCGKCGNPLTPDAKFCPKCGNVNSSFSNNQIIDNSKPKSKTTMFVIIGAVILWGIIISIFVIGSGSDDYYLDGGGDNNNPIVNIDIDDSNLVKIPGSSIKKGKYGTLFVFDNTYSGEYISDIDTANALIKKDSIEQKKACPKEIQKYEEQLMKDNIITAVNLCELDVDIAKEFVEAFKNLWNDYPGARGYLSNVGLYNPTLETRNAYAYFDPTFIFEESDNGLVFKSQIEINAAIYFNKSGLDKSLKADVAAGFHPKNTEARSSVIIHELGHYMEFVATLKKHNMSDILILDNNTQNAIKSFISDWNNNDFTLDILNAAYNKNKKEKHITIGFDDWRATVSEYAVAKDNEGKYIYKETIAEAVSDYAANRNKATEASIYIAKELQKRLGG